MIEKRRIGRSKGVRDHTQWRCPILFISQRPIGMDRAKARMVSVWAMGRKTTKTQRQNRIRGSIPLAMASGWIRKLTPILLKPIPGGRQSFANVNFCIIPQSGFRQMDGSPGVPNFPLPGVNMLGQSLPSGNIL